MCTFQEQGKKNDTSVPTLPIEKPAEYARNSAEIYSVQFILRFISNFALLRTEIEFQSTISTFRPYE